LGEAQVQGKPMYEAVGQMLSYLEDNDLADSNLDKKILENAIADTYQLILQSHYFLTDEITKMVTSLQQHVIHRFGSVDNYLNQNGIQVSDDFAALSALVGYPISAENIEESA
jgi:hypothetical protein